MSETKIYQIIPMQLSELDGWKVFCYDIYQDYLQNKDIEELKDLVSYVAKNPKRKKFRAVVQIGTIQFTVGVYPKAKELKLASKNLSYELMLLSYDKDESIPKFEAIREYTKDIASIPVDNSPVPIEVISSANSLPLFNESEFEQVHESSKNLSDELISKVSEYKQSLFERFSDFGLDVTANYALVRIHLLKFLAILPNLDHDKTGEEVKRILLETLSRLESDSNLALYKKLQGQNRPLPGLYLQTIKVIYFISQYIPAKPLAKFIRFSVSLMAKRFIAGENISKTKTALHSLLDSDRDATIDQLGELVVSNVEADLYCEKVLEIICGLKEHINIGSKNKAGLYRAHVSIKVSALCNDFKPQDFDYTYSQVSPRLIKILETAAKEHVFINIDAEHYHYRDIIFKIYEKVLLDTESLKDYEQTGIVVQAYLRDGIDHFNEVVALAKKRNIRMPIRLVKGAYWDAETIEADAHNFQAPQFLNKEETDIHFRQIIFSALKENEFIQLAVASHNIQDHCFARTMRSEMFTDAPEIEHQCLHMTYEALSVGLAKMGWPTRNYIPVGNLLVGMAYLVRRIMENSSQVGVLTIMRSHKKGLEIKTPTQKLRSKKDQSKLIYDNAISVYNKDFKNVYPIRTYLHKEFSQVDSEVLKLKQQLEAGNLIYDLGDTDVLCSSDTSIRLGTISLNSKADVDNSIDTLFKGFTKTNWANNNSIERFAILAKLADLLLIKREELTALIMFEAGKTLDEAIADVDEAIDFINFYIREQIKLQSNSDYNPKGVVGVIAPWNFPLAIPCGMTIAALVAGNSVILKPAEQTPLIGLKFVELCHEAGVPKDILQVVLGEAEVGKAIVDHPLITGVVFTGSKEVGEQIYRSITKQETSKKYNYNPISKFAITEMGGKNAIIVTNNSELDETVSGIIYSAFAHSGQKCSAASRVIIDEELKDAFIERFSEAVKDIKVGKSFNYSTVINPLITKEDQERVQTMAKLAKEEVLKLGGRVVVDLSQNEYPGYCVGPSVFEISARTVLSNDTIASKEVFGPLIHIIPYKNLDEAIEIFNATEYGLTGGIFCQSQNDIDYLVPKLKVGNIYINRPNTGARVAIEPFGGFKMSGTGPKAGGYDYLYQFNRAPETKEPQVKTNFKVETSIEDYIVRESKLSPSRRVFNSRKMVKQLINQFEFFFDTVDEDIKLKLEELLTSLENGEFDLETREFPNRYIPGQISFSKRNLPLGTGIVLDLNSVINVDSVLDFIVSLIVGNGISVITSNDIAYEQWKNFIELAHNCGFSKYNLSISNLTKDEIEKVLYDYDYHFALVVGSSLDQGFKDIILNKENSDYLVKIFYAGNNENLDQAIASFTNCRSFAINTMRHGAPLELTL